VVFCCVFLFSFSGFLGGQTGADRKLQDDDQRIRAAIRRFESSPDAPLGVKFNYVSRNVDLNRDGSNEIIVWIPEEDQGGTSGYPILVLARTKTGFRKLMSRDQGWTPIIVLNSKRGHWQDIAFLVAGGGATPTYFIYRNNGNGYKYNRSQINQPRGDVIIKKDWNRTTFGPIPKQ
jgi:hypothetical protein